MTSYNLSLDASIKLKIIRCYEESTNNLAVLHALEYNIPGTVIPATTLIPLSLAKSTINKLTTLSLVYDANKSETLSALLSGYYAPEIAAKYIGGLEETLRTLEMHIKSSIDLKMPAREIKRSQTLYTQQVQKYSIISTLLVELQDEYHSR